MNGLGRRVDNLELLAATQYVTRNEIGAALMQRVFDLADRYCLRPTPPVDQQSPGEQCIRAALADADGAEGVQEYAQRFWLSFVTRMKDYVREHDR